MSKSHKKHKHHHHSNKTSDHYSKFSETKTKHHSKHRKEKEPTGSAPPSNHTDVTVISSASTASKLKTASAGLPRPEEGTLTSVVPSLASSLTSSDASNSSRAGNEAVVAKVTCCAKKEPGVVSLLQGAAVIDTQASEGESFMGEPATTLLQQPCMATAECKEANTVELPNMAAQLMGGQGVELTPPTTVVKEKGEITSIAPAALNLLEHSPPSHLKEGKGVGRRASRPTDRSRSPHPSRAELPVKLNSSSGGEKKHHYHRQRSHSRSHKSKESGSNLPRTHSRTHRSHSRSRRSHIKSSRSQSRSRGPNSRSHRSRSRSRRSRSQRSRSRSQRFESQSKRSRSRSKRSRSRSQRSRSRRHRSRSKSRRTRRSCSGSVRSGSNSRSRRSGSHSRSRRSGSHSRSRRSGSHSRSRRSGSHSRSEYGVSHSEHTPLPLCVAQPITVLGSTPPTSTLPPTSITTAAPPTSLQPTNSKQSTISLLVSKCKELVEKQAMEDKTGVKDGSQFKESIGKIRAPFVVAPTPSTGLVFHSGAWKTPNQVALEAPAKPLETLYPVSAGLQHHDNQPVGGASGVVAVQSVALGELVAKRLEATARLQVSPSDVVAMETLAEVAEKTSRWCQSMMKPGQFTGAKFVKPMSMKEHQTGHQAWVKKSMFKGLAPVSGGFGMKMMKKMGWEEGCPLGRSGQGHVEPIEVEVKMDRHGLGSGDKSAPKAAAPSPALGLLGNPGSDAAKLLHGKHPVCVLQEVCAKKHWGVPSYELVSCGGPDHMKTFLFKVTTGIGSFQPAVSSPNKKQAKTQAAVAALQGLGLLGSGSQYVI